MATVSHEAYLTEESEIADVSRLPEMTLIVFAAVARNTPVLIDFIATITDQHRAANEENGAHTDKHGENTMDTQLCHFRTPNNTDDAG
ncbi:hypothetical protein DPMN_078794 [Dreissena polymorpha]|uniref:Uncharacterized protein n=1 Tax=Dreissena polymorpha TaxID=45954 RepID=A0A9D3YRW6_DREPO|nr:hypothetical protein DPMN_078794 [Dreissena polymorpha]